jgi:hypothetical protein
MSHDFREPQREQSPWWRRLLGYVFNPPSAGSAQDSRRPDLGIHVYVARIPGEGMQEIVSLLSEDAVFAHGLVPQAVIGKLLRRSDEGGALTPANFAVNTSFVDFLHDVIGRRGADHPDLMAEARRLGSGRVYVIDGRTPTPQGDVPPTDILGAFRVEAGAVEPGSYERNPNHRVLSDNGFFRLEPALQEQLLVELTTLSVGEVADPA